MPVTPVTPAVRVQVMSDLHLEFVERGGSYAVDGFFDGLDPADVDVLVLAGDITRAGRILKDLSRFARIYGESEADVVYVPGNHEYYGTDPKTVETHMIEADTNNENLHVLGVAGTAIVKGLRFVGGTLWFPEYDPATVAAGRWSMNDFNLISGFEPWVYEAHADCVRTIESYAAAADVVVTHHLPSRVCIAPEFQTSPLNPFFVHDMTPTIERDQPPLWIYGHTHFPQEHLIGETRLVCNPKGYPGETRAGRPPFNKCLVVDVTPKPREETP